MPAGASDGFSRGLRGNLEGLWADACLVGMWHSVAALVPLPVIGLGYVAAVPGNPVAFQIELYFAGSGSAQALTHRADVAPQRLPREAALLFRASGKGPRADHYRAPNTFTSAGKQLIVASAGGDPGVTGALGRATRSSGDQRRPAQADQFGGRAERFGGRARRRC